MTKKTDAKADRSKLYVAAEDTIIEGRPVRKGVDISTKDMTDGSLQSYLDAGLLEEAVSEDDAGDADKAKLNGKVSEDLSADAARIDQTKDKRTEK